MTTRHLFFSPAANTVLEDKTAVQISNCDAPPCKLQRLKNVTIEQRFTPDRDIADLTTAVHATLLGVPLPFIGVDGTPACGHIVSADGQKSGCPLKKGVEYLYKNEFPVLRIYPTVGTMRALRKGRVGGPEGECVRIRKMASPSSKPNVAFRKELRTS